MSETLSAGNWPELYKNVLLESDPASRAARIDEAHRAIRQRALELWNLRSSEITERRDLDLALNVLELLKAISVRATQGSLQQR